MDLFAPFHSAHKPTLHHLMAMQMKCPTTIHHDVYNCRWPLNRLFVFRLFTARDAVCGAIIVELVFLKKSKRDIN
jgi:hypothetical protein